MSINMASIEKKVAARLKQSDMKKEISRITDEKMIGAKGFGGGSAKHTPDEAASKFINILQNAIRGSVGENFKGGEIGSEIAEKLTHISHSKPRKVADGKYEISIWFDTPLERESLDLVYFDEGVENIAALLNKGYNAKNPVYGVWMGHHMNSWIKSIQNRDGAHFIENAIRDFNSSYKNEYGVISIVCDDIYDIREN